MKPHNELIKTPEYWLSYIQNDLFRILDEYMVETGKGLEQISIETGINKRTLKMIYNGNFNGSLEKMINIVLQLGKAPNFSFDSIDKFKK